jgi:hypothetical protein
VGMVSLYWLASFDGPPIEALRYVPSAVRRSALERAKRDFPMGSEIQGNDDEVTTIWDTKLAEILNSSNWR